MVRFDQGGQFYDTVCIVQLLEVNFFSSDHLLNFIVVAGKILIKKGFIVHLYRLCVNGYSYIEDTPP